MHNPTYLSLSRHNVYYFRYPLPLEHKKQGYSNHIKLSLQTREPKEALRLARVLEYHAYIMTQQNNLQSLSHAEIVSLLKNYFREVLDKAKSRIDQDGPLSKINASNLLKELDNVNYAIEHEYDEIHSNLFNNDDEIPEELSIKPALNKIQERHNIKLTEDSDEYRMLKEEYKYAFRNYLKDLLAYSNNTRDYSLHNQTHNKDTNVTGFAKHEHRLSLIIDKYLKEMSRSGEWAQRTETEARINLNYLKELLGDDFNILSIKDKALYVKEILSETPKHRGKRKETRDLPLLEQIKVKGLDKLTNRTINKYLQTYRSLFQWAVDNGFINSNPFENIQLKDSKKNKRDAFSKEDMKLMLSELSKGKEGLANDDMKYWGAMLLIYTGARRNEIASLTPNDIKYDQESGIWYIEINDEDEAKQLKTEASKRIVPLHKQLLENGFLDYIEKVKGMRQTGPYSLRLLYKLTYAEGQGWGRKLGRWFNEQFLVKLKIKEKTRKTLHSLRHSFITNLNAKGVEAQYIKLIVGHDQDTVTFGIYNHVSLDHLPTLKEAVDRLEY